MNKEKEETAAHMHLENGSLWPITSKNHSTDNPLGPNGIYIFVCVQNVATFHNDLTDSFWLDDIGTRDCRILARRTGYLEWTKCWLFLKSDTIGLSKVSQCAFELCYQIAAFTRYLYHAR